MKEKECNGMESIVIFLASILFLTLSFILGVLQEKENFNSTYYPATFVVVVVNKTDDVVSFQNSNGYQYLWKGVEDWSVGDMASAIMDSKETSNISDDTILKVHYCGFSAKEGD